MIQIMIKDNQFSYDMRALALAFYPEKKCEIIQNDEWCSKDGFSVIWKIDGNIEYEHYFPYPYTKNEVKKEVYSFLSDYSGKILPWGILTGIRPAKIALRQIMSGIDPMNAQKALLEEYMCQPAKAKLATDVAKREYELTGHLDHEKGINLYIGIPFCPSICAYCSFSSYAYKQYEEKVDQYLDALEREMQYVSGTLSNRILRSIYIGGGTPTSLSEIQFERLLCMVDKFFPIDSNVEYTVEAGRPDSITEEKLKSMRTHHVTRISINPQSMKQHTLDLLGRKHTIEQVKDVFETARNLGFDNINMDLIVGLPEETPDDFAETLQAVYDMHPDSITVHTLVIKRASRMRKEQLESGREMRQADENIATMQDMAEAFCRNHGYEPYYMYRQKNKASTTRNTNQENVAYALPGKECLYNIFIMEELETIIALGSGGSSKIVFADDRQMERVENVKSVDDYISRIDDMIQRKKNASSNA